jgi:hypothetical protein
MSGSFEVADGRFTIINGARTVTSTDGTLVNLLPAQYDISETVAWSFPDFTKDYRWQWSWLQNYSSAFPSASRYSLDNSCVTEVTVIPQEWSAVSDIVTVPDGADIFVGLVRLTRTAAPAFSWGGSTLDVLTKTGVWIPMALGSMLLEAEYSMGRACSLIIEEDVDGDKQLRLHRQQSVGAAPGGFGTYGETLTDYTSNHDGGENAFGSVPGLPVYQIQARNSTPTAGEFPGIKETHRKGFAGFGASPCSTADPTNYSSSYKLEVTGAFGRRS